LADVLFSVGLSVEIAEPMKEKVVS
jgi:hypothetical protein